MTSFGIDRCATLFTGSRKFRFGRVRSARKSKNKSALGKRRRRRLVRLRKKQRLSSAGLRRRH